MNRTTLSLLIYGCLAVFFGWETYRAWTDPIVPGDAARVGVVFARPSASEQPKPEGRGAQYAGLSTILARPVFRPDRRPYQEGSAAVPARNYQAELSRYTVLGILMMEQEKKAVVVSNAGGESGRWEVGVGDSLAGFTVQEIDTDGIVLTADGKEFPLPLYAGGPKAVRGSPLRTEVAPAPSPAGRRGPAARPAPGAARPSPAQPLQQKVGAPSPVPAPTPQASPQIRRRIYPRRYVPGRR